MTSPPSMYARKAVRDAMELLIEQGVQIEDLLAGVADVCNVTLEARATRRVETVVVNETYAPLSTAVEEPVREVPPPPPTAQPQQQTPAPQSYQAAHLQPQAQVVPQQAPVIDDSPNQGEVPPPPAIVPATSPSTPPANAGSVPAESQPRSSPQASRPVSTSPTADLVRAHQSTVSSLPEGTLQALAQHGGFDPIPMVLRSGSFRVRELDLGNNPGSYQAYLHAAAAVAVAENPELLQQLN